MKVAVAILNWNGRQLLEQFLPAMVKYSLGDATIYIADNASTDDSIEFIKDNYPEIKIVQNKENDGFAKGYNDALQHVKADIYALVNSDIEVTKDWLKPIVKQFKSEPNTAAIQPKILDYKNRSQFEYAGAAGGYLDALGYPYCRGRVFNTLEKDNGQFNDISDIFWASGACFFIRSKIYHQLNGFDESYFAHQEEIDLCWRLQNEGHNIQYVSQSIVYHVGGATLNEGSPKKTYLNFRNSLFSIVKNIPKKRLITTIISRLFLDGIAGIKFIFEFKPLHTLAIIKAHFNFYVNLSSVLSKRKNQINKKDKYYHSKSIVWQYFVLGIRVFKEIKI